MAGVNPIFLLIVFQGFYLGSVGQLWLFPNTITALIGSCVEIPCTYLYDGTSGPSSPVWYSYNKSSFSEILNTKDSSSVQEEYRNRTSLVPGESCTLRIDPVRREDGDKYYYPGGFIGDKYINTYGRDGMIPLFVIDSPRNISLNVPEATEGEATTIRCSADHTCGSNPPSLQWNRPGEVKNQSVQGYQGQWSEESELTFSPSYMDDGSSVQCTATYPNGQKTQTSETLKIYYAAIGVYITMKKEHIFTALMCDFQRSRPDVTHYTWMKNGSILHNETEKTLTLYNNEESNGQYSCIAHNRAGESYSEEIDVTYDEVNLPLIWGTVVGVFVLVVLLVFYVFRFKVTKKK